MLTRINSMIQPLRDISNTWLSPALDLIIRLYMANVFFVSGMLKFKNLINGQWSSTVFLFEIAHPVPGIPANVAAAGATAGEIILPILLALGLFGRVGAAGLLIMTLVIQFAVPAEYEISNPDHYFWMLLLAVPLLKGPGKLSIDYLIERFILIKNT